MVVVIPEYGFISYFGPTATEKYSQMTARCFPGRHNARCSVKRGIALTSHMSGRPLGLLAAWLLLEDVPDGDHTNPFRMGGISRVERLAAREFVMTLPNGPLLADRELRPPPGGDAEPP